MNYSVIWLKRVNTRVYWKHCWIKSLLTKKNRVDEEENQKALTYPIAVVVVAFIVTAILLLFVVPVFEDLFKGFGADLPAFTRMVVNMSEWLQEWWWIFLHHYSGCIYVWLFQKTFSSI